VAWKVEWDPQRTRCKKIPINPHTGRYASSTDPSTWGTFAQAHQRMRDDDLDGIGFVFTPEDPYVGIDLDGALMPEGHAPWAEEILDRLDTYTERSVSGTGLHLILKSDHLPDQGKRQDGLEVYSQGRYFTMTGLPVEGRETIQDRSDPFSSWYEEAFPATTRQDPEHVTKPSAPNSPTAVVLSVEDQDVIASCRRRWPKFCRLYDDGDLRDYNGNHSQADLGLVNYCVKAGVRDADRLDRLFRSSALMRPKWEREDYRRLTIQTALDGTVVPGELTLSEEEQLRCENEELKEKLVAAETRAQRNGDMLNRLTGIMSNAKLGNVRFVAQALAIKFAALESQGREPPYQISVTEIVDTVGGSRQTLSKHIKRLVKAGLMTCYTVRVRRNVDGQPSDILRPTCKTFMAPEGTALDFATAVADLDLHAKWGGSRPGAFGRKTPDGDVTEAGNVRAFPDVTADSSQVAKEERPPIRLENIRPRASGSLPPGTPYFLMPSPPRTA
jgi:DNA-binding Lrp family transcriptional regulator